jgi:hypothetical protein
MSQQEVSQPNTSAPPSQTAVLVQASAPSATQALKQQQYFEMLLERRMQLVYGIGKLVATTVKLIEDRFWAIWSSGDPKGHMLKVDWRCELDKTVLTKVIALKRRRVDVLEERDFVVLVAAMLSNYFNNIYQRILRNETIEELQPLVSLFDYSAFTLLSIWAHQTANIHLSLDRLSLSTLSRERYVRSLDKQLNQIINGRMGGIEREVCSVTTDWNISTIEDEKPFCFMVQFESSDRSKTA